METEDKYNIKETSRSEGLEIINFLIGYHEIKLNEVDFEE